MKEYMSCGHLKSLYLEDVYGENVVDIIIWKEGRSKKCYKCWKENVRK